MASRAARSAVVRRRRPVTIAFLDQPARQLRHPLDLVGDGAQLLVEDDAAELPRLLLQRHLQVLLPEEAGVGEPRGEHAAVALDDRLAAVVRVDVGDADEGRRQRPASSVQAKYFWLVRMVSTITSRGTSRKSASKRPSNGTGHSVSPAFSTTSPSSSTSFSPASAAAFAAPSRMSASRSSWSTMTWQARNFSA